MAKPIGPICNLDCAYCYYLHKEELYPGTSSWRMPLPTLETYLRQLIEAQPAETKEVTFAWQGGEPTLLGLEFFQRVVALQASLAPRGVRIVNTLQTNGTLLDEAWVAFFREHRFLIGLSIDGPADLHDRYRFDKKGDGTFATVLHALQRLRREQVEFNALVVVNRQNGDHGRRVYTYLRDNGVEYFQFIPIVERRGIGRHAEPLVTLSLDGLDRATASGNCDVAAGSTGDSSSERTVDPADLISSRSVLPEQFGRFLMEVFDEWIRRDVGRVFVQSFDQALSAWMGVEPSLCVFRRECGRALAIEHNGDVYSCDHFVETDYLLGNIESTPLGELANSERQRAFGKAKWETLPRYCRECDVRFACNGECPKNRFLQTPDGEGGLNYLCSGYRTFFRHIAPAMEMMVEELRAGRAAANVMARWRNRSFEKRGRRRPPSDASTIRTGGLSPQPQQNRQAVVPLRGNDLCPCGSGRKYKRCCEPG